MGFQDAVRTGFSKYVDFQGRAARPEYWWWVLFMGIATIVLQILDAVLFGSFGGIGVLYGVFSLAMLLPGISVSIRRLHDVDKSGWLLLIGFIPLIGALVLFYFLAQRGTIGPNRFGPEQPA